MENLSKIDVTYASDVQRDDFFAEFECDGDTWGEMAFNANAASYEEAYVLTLFGSQSTSNIVLSVAELERVLQTAKWRITPVRDESDN